MLTETEITTGDGRTLHVYDTAAGDDGRLAVFWHHGTPNLGPPPAPLLPASERLGVRWVSYERPGYGRSTRLPGRTVASAADDVACLADALGIERFAVVGHSGGAMHALACAALLTERVVGVVGFAALSPFDAEGLDWYAGMGASSAANLRAAAEGREALERHQATSEFDMTLFTPTDRAALRGTWSWLGAVAAAAASGDPGGAIDDDLAYVAPWKFDPARVRSPALFVHGDEDRIAPGAHAAWLARRVASAELWRRPTDGHVSVLDAGEQALAWLCQRAPPR